MSEQILTQKLKNRLLLLTQLDSATQPLWGLMTPQHMIEHLGGIIYGTALGKGQDVILPSDEAAKWKARFFSTYYPFPRNIRMAGTQDTPVQLFDLKYESIEEAKEKLTSAIDLFLKAQSDRPEQKAGHGYFGEMDMNEWLSFHVKHLEHHLMQFGAIPYDEKVPVLEKLIYKLGKNLNADAPAQFGAMNAQQMVEHLGMVFLLSMGKFDFPYRGTEEDAAKYWQLFVSSDRPWIESFPRKSFGDPRPPRHDSIEDSKQELKKTFSKYLAFCESNPDSIQPHFYLGNLDVDQWKQVHLKHIQHHMRQFGLNV